MMEEPLSRGASPSGDSSLSGGGEIVATTNANLEERLIEAPTRNSLNLLRTPPARKAKRVRFFRNGDKFYTGVVIAVTPERYRSFDSLAMDLTRALISNVTLPNGVRAIYTMDGRKVLSVGELEDGKCYICSGQGEAFKKVEYSASKVRRGSSLSGLPQSPAGSGRPNASGPVCVQARIVTLIRHGTKPRKVLRLLLNKRNAPSLEHAFEAITEAVKLDSGAVRKVYTLSGNQVTALEQFFENEEIFVAYGTDKSCQDDFELDFEETKAVQSFKRGPCLSKRSGGPMPPMPKKSGKKALSIPQIRTPSPVFVQLPLPLRMHFIAGHVIGDGNFAVVRHCVQRKTGMEYAMKIIDKHKCQGQGTMLDSEVAIMRQVCHPNIISLIAEQETSDQLFLVMELVKGGDLFDAIAAATKFSEAEASVMISHLMSALAYLHSHHIVHRDVKPENLLVEMEGSRVMCLKLGDFGLAQVVRGPLYTVCGTPTYVAPEILAETGYGLKIDVWAAGVIMYILLCGFPPFVSPENEQEELFERILSGHYEYTAPYWDSISESAKQLVSNMLQVQPELRFSAEDVLDHPWLASFLGGERTTAAAESSEQHWYKQRQPIRQATFDYHYDSNGRDTDNRHPFAAPSSSLSDSSVTQGRWSEFANSRNTYDHADLASSDSQIDEIDFGNGYGYDQTEPQSLDNECLENIRAMTKSMYDLTDNIERPADVYLREKPKSARNSTTALNNHATASTNLKKTSGHRVPASNKKSQDTKDSARSKAKGNSTSDIRCRSAGTSSPTRQRPSYGNGCNTDAKKKSLPNSRVAKSSETLDSAKSQRNGKSNGAKIMKTTLSKSSEQSLAKKVLSRVTVTKAQQRQSNELAKSTTFSKTKDVDVGNSNVFSSYDDVSSSDNDIETSDSFVNIQFARYSHSPRSNSSQSIESTDSFENVQFARYRTSDDNHPTNSPLRNHETRESNANRKEVVKTANKTPNTDPKSTSSRKIVEPSKSANRNQENVSAKAEKLSVIRREKKPTARISTSTDELTPKNEVLKHKRFSSYTPVVTRRVYDEREVTNDKSNHTSSGERGTKDKKFSSTDELRESRQKQSQKPKRFSLYYTPQPLRKTYLNDAKTSKDAKKIANEKISQSSGNSRVICKNTAEVVATSQKKEPKNRKPVCQSTTAASRNRSNKQNIHIRPSAVDAIVSQTK